MEQVAGEVCGRGARVWGFRVVWDGQKDARDLGQFWLTTIVSDIPKPLALILYLPTRNGEMKEVSDTSSRAQFPRIFRNLFYA